MIGTDSVLDCKVALLTGFRNGGGYHGTLCDGLRKFFLEFVQAFLAHVVYFCHKTY